MNGEGEQGASSGTKPRCRATRAAHAFPVTLPGAACVAATHTQRYSVYVNANMHSRHLVTTCEQMHLLGTETQHKIKV